MLKTYFSDYICQNTNTVRKYEHERKAVLSQEPAVVEAAASRKGAAPYDHILALLGGQVVREYSLDASLKEARKSSDFQ